MFMEPSDDIQARSRHKGKLPQLSTLQPEDSAEQLSSIAVPSRQGRARAAAHAQQMATLADSTPASVVALMQAAKSSSSGHVAPQASLAQPSADSAAAGLAPTGHAFAGQSSVRRLQQPEVSSKQQFSTLRGQSNDTEGAAGSDTLAVDLESAADADVVAVGGQQHATEAKTAEFVGQHSQRQSSWEAQGQQVSPQGHVQAGELLQHADSKLQQDQQPDSSMQLAQQESLASEQEQGAAAGLHRRPMHDEPEASTSQRSRQKQVKRGESVYAARDLTVLEQYEADVVHAYATSFLAEAMLQGMLPAAANTMAADEHSKLLAEARQRNALTKVRHHEEVKAERAAWEAHEEIVKR